MSSQSSTLFTVGTLLRHAADASSPVRVLVQGAWIAGVPVGADGMGVVLDSAEGQVLVRLDQVSAVAFDREHIEASRDETTGGGEQSGEEPPVREGHHVQRPAVGAGASART